MQDSLASAKHSPAREETAPAPAGSACLLGFGSGEVDAAVGAGGWVALGVGPPGAAELGCQLLLHRRPRCNRVQLLQVLS